MTELVLTGLYGTNPIGILAALGVLEALSGRDVPVTLRWQDNGSWCPVLRGVEGGLDDLIDLINQDRLTCLHETALALEYGGKRDIKPLPARFREYLLNLLQAATPDSRRGVDWAASFATDVIVDNNGNTKPTALHFTAGQQQFLSMARSLAEGVTSEDLRAALLGPWRYDRALPVMGWDSTIARDYALRASNPSTDKKLGVPGADWLAVRGLAALPVFPVGKRANTTGCVGGWKNGAFRWPLWVVPLTRDMARVVMRLDCEGWSRDERSALGIGLVLGSKIRRHETGGRGSFEPATVL